MKISLFFLFLIAILGIFTYGLTSQTSIPKNSFNKAIITQKVTPKPQTTAIFHADTTRINSLSNHNLKLSQKLLEMKWLINNQILRFGSPPIAVEPNSDKLDTIFFQKDNQAKWDTLICNIAEANTYQFVFNSCCGAFDVQQMNTKKRFIQGRIAVQLTSETEHQQFIGTLGEAGRLIKNSRPDTLKPACRSAMSPNIYWVSLKEIVPCNNSVDCEVLMCLFDEDKEMYDYEYVTKEEITKFLYLPLSRKPLSLTYNLSSQKLIIK